jgi:hypothetical protein
MFREQREVTEHCSKEVLAILALTGRSVLDTGRTVVVGNSPLL